MNSTCTHVSLYLHVSQHSLTHATAACRHIFVMERMRPDAVEGPANEGAATVCLSMHCSQVQICSKHVTAYRSKLTVGRDRCCSSSATASSLGGSTMT